MDNITTELFIDISNHIPKNIHADLNTLIRVTGDFFLREGGGGDFLTAAACRAHLPSMNVTVQPRLSGLIGTGRSSPDNRKYEY